VAPGVHAAIVDSDFAGVQYELCGEGPMANTELTCQQLCAIMAALSSSHGLPEDARLTAVSPVS